MEQNRYAESPQNLPIKPFLNGNGAVAKSELRPKDAKTSGIGLKMDTPPLDERVPDKLTVGVIDCYRFSQECLIRALENLHPRLVIAPFATPDLCIAEHRTDIDLILYYFHESSAPEAGLIHDVSAIYDAFPNAPLVVLSDADDAQQAKTFRSTLKSGAKGFIPTKTTGVPITLAAIRLVREGGVFAPMDLAMTNRVEHSRPLPETVCQNPHPLTARQRAVLAHMQRGSANKIIAHELEMSESTVKVHVRNIMRKVGATNRTQAVYKAQKLLDGIVSEKKLEQPQ